MYSNSHPARYLAPTLSSQYIPSSYGDFSDYHHQVPEFGDPLCDTPTAAWSRAYAAPREEWSTFGHGFPGSSPIAGQASYETPEFTALHSAFGGGSCASLTKGPGDPFTNSVISKSYEWTRDSWLPVSRGRTRTKDKYRVVYSDHQRLELEKEFQYSRYITIRKKSQLSLELHLSERQVKIWFQNRRAKERKLTRRKQQVSQQASATSQSPEEANSDPPPRTPPVPPVQC
ncbi:unnamed protein product [Lota lota]